MKASYPSLLSKKATLIGNLTRTDLLVLGMSYLVLSWMKVSGLLSLLLIVFVLGVLVLIKKYVMPGFFSQLIWKRSFDWTQGLERFHE